ncbi:DUF2950 domain-containing protein [Kaistia algarum]|uniref:DUF2950 domain-containing protein n=1 Tax=Kaistia algarum TaxID=2083279 RepID=UPI000CE8367C|nr:DUF2950 domain-containing protein [Kaistia algarum]MCX5515417.1 DUF2950 domain-containing protein [Kaistia algarum]PPE78521.1 DUF2950 domain-containing protein [Kaistia algarum]
MPAIRNIILAMGIAGAVWLVPALPAAAQQVFPTPEAASAALVDGARHPGQGWLDKIFGDGGGDLFTSGDADVDRQQLADFLGLAENGTSVVDGENGEKRLVFGASGWQFPVPLKKGKDGWTFDLAAGRQAVIDRAVGRNELLAIDACADYVAAQNEYFASLHDDEPVQQYARRFLSSEGLHDGLYWEPESQTDISPLGDRIAAVESGEGDEPGTYHGYHFRILTRQGPEAPGGAYDYLVNGRLLAGFAMLAYPAEWGSSGVMSFLCDQRGEVYQSNIGPQTDKLATRILSFNPGPGWAVVPTE